jgi:hypothetical protein
MRGDMPKVIVERPRSGSRMRLRNRARVEDDERLPSKLGMKRDARERGGYRMLNENLAPLRRYLEAQVGRPWNKVWSEICENLKPSNTVQQHVRDHIGDFVATKTSLKDGEVWVHHHRWSRGPLKGSHVKLFVDPKSGLLRKNKHWRSWTAVARARKAQEAKAREARMRIVSATRQLHLLDDGAWWEVTLASVPTGVEEVKTRHGVRRHTFEKAVEDAVLRAGLSGLDRAALYGRAGVYAVAKRQLSKKEMRDSKLR